MKTKIEHELIRDEISGFLNNVRKNESPKKKFVLEITNTYKGFSSYNVNLEKYIISVPIWAIAKGINYLKAYAIHEFVHCLVGFSCGHNNIFKRNERRLLKKYLEIVKVKYKRAYIYSAYNVSGESVFNIDNKGD